MMDFQNLSNMPAISPSQMLSADGASNQNDGLAEILRSILQQLTRQTAVLETMQQAKEQDDKANRLAAIGVGGGRDNALDAKRTEKDGGAVAGMHPDAIRKPGAEGAWIQPNPMLGVDPLAPPLPPKKQHKADRAAAKAQKIEARNQNRQQFQKLHPGLVKAAEKNAQQRKKRRANPPPQQLDRFHFNGEQPQGEGGAGGADVTSISRERPGGYIAATFNGPPPSLTGEGGGSDALLQQIVQLLGTQNGYLAQIKESSREVVS